MSALTGGVRVASCKGPRGCRLGVKTVPDRGLTSAQALQPLAQLRQKSPKASIVRGSLNSVGLILVSLVLLWQSIERLLHPVPVQGVIAIAVGIAAAAANWGVARLLLEPGRNNAAIRLAYIHNMGDVYVSLAPVAAGLLVAFSGYAIFDTMIAAAIALWFITSTGREVFQSHEELIWPEKIVCGHPEHVAEN